MNRLATIQLLLFCSLLTFACDVMAQQWVEVRSPHFSVATDAGEGRGREVAERFEQMRSAFGVLFNRMNVNIPVPLQIVALHSQKEFRDYVPLWNGKPVELTGFFQPAEDRNFIVLDLSSPGKWDTVFHEYAHLLINSNLPPMPVWYDEGIAEYCSTLKAERNEIEFGLAPANLVSVLRQNAWMHLPELLGVGHESSAYNDTDRRPVFYAQSWITVHYLMAHQRMKELAAYVELTENRKLPVREAVRQAFGIDAAQLEAAVRDYFTRGSLKYFRLPAPAALASVPYRVRKLEELEWQSVLADLHYHSKDHRERGIAEFRNILQRQPANAAANRGLGYVYLRQNDFDRAAEHFARAAAADSQDSRVHYFAALLMNRKAMIAGRAPDDLPAMKREVQAAIALDANYADAYNLLAYAEGTGGNLVAARAAIKRAVELSPRNEFYLANQALYEMQAQAWDSAEEILNRLKNSTNPELSQMARRNLEEVAAQQRPRKPSLTTPAPSAWDGAAPQWKPKGTTPESEVPEAETQQPEESPEAESTPAPAPQMQSIRFLKGRLVSVDCSTKPGAVLKIAAGNKTLEMFTRDVSGLLLIGVDKFSCAWTDRKVSVNYRLKTDGRGELVSLEID